MLDRLPDAAQFNLIEDASAFANPATLIGLLASAGVAEEDVLRRAFGVTRAGDAATTARIFSLDRWPVGRLELVTGGPDLDRLSDVDIRGERPVQANGVSATRDVSIAHGRKPETQLSLAVRVRIPSHAGNALRDRGRPDTLTDSMAAYRTTFPINASSEVVWGVLVDFERYPEWNPSLPSIAGDLRVGSIVSMTLAMPGRPSPKVKAEFTEVVPQRRLVWHGNVGADWLFAGDRQFIIDPGDGDTVNFTHVEDVHGLLFPLFRAVMGRAIQRHHDALNTALTRRAEELAAEAASSQ